MINDQEFDINNSENMNLLPLENNLDIKGGLSYSQ